MRSPMSDPSIHCSGRFSCWILPTQSRGVWALERPWWNRRKEATHKTLKGNPWWQPVNSRRYGKVVNNRALNFHMFRQLFGPWIVSPRHMIKAPELQRSSMYLRPQLRRYARWKIWHSICLFTQAYIRHHAGPNSLSSNKLHQFDFAALKKHFTCRVGVNHCNQTIQWWSYIITHRAGETEIAGIPTRNKMPIDEASSSPPTLP